MTCQHCDSTSTYYTGRGRYYCNGCGRLTIIPTISHNYVMVTAAGAYVDGAGKLDVAWAATWAEALQPAPESGIL